MENMVSRSLSVHKEHELLLKLENAGLTEPLAQKVIDSKGNEVAKKVVKFIQNGGFEPTTSQKRAQEIMGENFFGVKKASQFFGVKPTRQQLFFLSWIPFSEKALQRTKNTHVLVACFPLSILKISEKVDSKLFCDQWRAWYEESFANFPGEISWQLVLKTPVDNSTSKSWREQLSLIGKNGEVPTAQIMVYTVIGHYLATRERLFQNIYVRTSSIAMMSRRVNVGTFDPGLHVFIDEGPLENVGLSAMRKHDLRVFS